MSEESTSGRGVAGLVGTLGWLIAMVGAALLGYGIYLLIHSKFDVAANGPLVASGAVTFSLGLLCVVNATLARAMIVTANNTARSSNSVVAVDSVPATVTATDDLPDMEETSKPDDEATASAGAGDAPDTDDASAQQDFEPAPYAPSQPSQAPIVPDTSDPRGWPLAIDEFNVDGHLAMTLEDGSIAIETPVGWRRLPNLDMARTWLSQQPR